MSGYAMNVSEQVRLLKRHIRDLERMRDFAPVVEHELYGNLIAEKEFAIESLTE